MYKLQMWNGKCGARLKRARHGMEKMWNKYDEPFRRFLGGHFSKKRWLEHKAKKQLYLPDKD